MLKIREEQMEALRGYSNRQYAKQISTNLRKHYPGATQNIEQEDLILQILDSIAIAEPFGITGKSSVESFLGLTMIWGAQFPDSGTTPWARAVLEADVPQAGKVRTLWSKTKAIQKAKQ